MKYLWILAIILLAAVLFLLLRRRPSLKISAEELAAKDELLNNAKQFSGCFQALLQAVQESNAPLVQVLLDVWKQQTAEFSMLGSVFDAVCCGDDPISNANAWLKTLSSWGIVHDTPGTLFTITAEQETLYLFDDVYGPNTQAKVVRPAWWIQEADLLICMETGGAEIQ